jgi:hypothetical protein
LILPIRVCDVVDDAAGAALRKGLDHRRADAAGAAGDEHYFAGEIERIDHECFFDRMDRIMQDLRGSAICRKLNPVNPVNPV